MFLVEDDPLLVRAVTDLLAGRGHVLDGSCSGEVSRVTSFRSGPLKVDFKRGEIRRDGTRLSLSEREGRLLQFLVINRGNAVSRETLLEYVWGYRRAPLTRTVDVTILRLRQKIETNPREPHFIITVPGLGYRFNG